MSIAPELVGAWRRVGLLVDGVRQVDLADVLWLQTAEWFADIRLPLDPHTPPPAGRPIGFWREGAFAGVAEWEPPRLTWHHLLDIAADPGPSPQADSSPLTWADGVVAEHLTVTIGGQQLRVVEEWLRMADDTAASSLDVSEVAVRVEVGRWAVSVRDDRPGGRFIATRYEAGAAGWQAVGSVTADPSPGRPEPQDPPPAASRTVSTRARRDG